MAKIRQLPIHEAQKIAAGEVVERPANVVKELVENALDAKSSSISLYIEDGGKKLIRIIDNGTGMSSEDAHMCIKHHATSKITTIHDLETITTFGFRGEALSSIAAVSKITLITKEIDAAIGTQLEIEESSVVKETAVACNAGTDIAVQDLFYNVPARKKFLKTKETEWRAILQLFYAFCLDYPMVSFKLYSENKLVHNCPGVQHISIRLAQLYESSLAQSILLIENTGEDRMDLGLSGAICQPNYNRYDRNCIFLFVNQRWVKNHKLSQAFIKGYQKMLQPERYPVGFIFINIDPKCVDINIHPRKEEVQFLHPRIVENFIEATVKQRLEAYHAQNLGIKLQPYLSQQSLNQQEITVNNIKEKEQALPSEAEKQNFLAMLNQNFTPPKLVQPQLPVNQSIILPAPIAENSISQPIEKIVGNIIEAKIESVVEKDTINFTLIGQVLFTYIIIETEEGLVLIDQHAAHERIMYERLGKKFNEIIPVKLLFPNVINLISHDISLLSPYLSLFATFGVTIEQISNSELIVHETPIFLKNQPLDDLIKQVISLIHENCNIEANQLRKIIQEKIHAQMSCKSAIKAGDKLTIESMNNLIKELYNTENKLTCPHGRPTIWPISKYEIEKKFKRNYK